MCTPAFLDIFHVPWQALKLEKNQILTYDLAVSIHLLQAQGGPLKFFSILVTILDICVYFEVDRTFKSS